MKKRAAIDTFLGLIKRLALIRHRKDFYTFIIFIAVSSFIWFSIQLSQQYEQIFQYRIDTQIIDSEEFVLIDCSHDVLEATVKSSGFQILKYSFLKRSLSIDFEIRKAQLSYSETDSLYHLAIPKNKFLSYSKGNSLVSIETNLVDVDSLYFVFDRLIKRKLKVVPIYNIEYRNFYAQSGIIEVAPDSINIVGPFKSISNLSYIPTDSISLLDVNQHVEAKLTLDLSDLSTHTQLNDQSVELFIPVSEFIPASFTLELQIDSILNDDQIRLFPSQVTLSCLVAINRFNDLKSSDFRVIVEFEENNTSSSATVTLTRFPDYVRSVKVEPEQVEFIYLNND